MSVIAKNDLDNPTAETNGWLGKLSLSFESRLASNQQLRTELIDRKQIGPLTIQRPFYPEGSPCHLYLLHPPGGVVGGDRLELDVSLAKNSHLLMTMPGATKFYRSNGKTAFLHQQFNLSDNSVLEWLPQDTIFFAGAKAKLKTEFTLQSTSKLLGWESLCFGRPVMNERFDEGEVKSHLTIHTPNGIGLNEHLRIIDGCSAVIGHYAYSAMFFAYPVSDVLLQLVRDTLKTCTTPVGATCLDELLVVRILSDDNLACQQHLYQLWHLLRPYLLNIPPCPPRIWAT